MLQLTSEAEFDALKEQNDVLVAYFTTSACSVGEALLPKVEALLEENEAAGVVVNTTELPAVGGQHLVLTVPTVLVFVFGREFDRLSRHISLSAVDKAVTDALRTVAD